MKEPTKLLHRYTDLPALLSLLQKRQLTLLNPESWDDHNDSHFMALYKKSKKITCLLALCFSLAEETYHHWRVFAHGSGGIRISFDFDALVENIDQYEGIRCGTVKYRLIDEIKTKVPAVKDLPFLKRAPYRPEEEYRVIYESTEFEQRPVNFDLPLSTIRRITLSPWMNVKLVKAVRETIHLIAGCSELRVSHSTLISNDTWQKYGDAAVGENLKGSEVTLLKKD